MLAIRRNDMYAMYLFWLYNAKTTAIGRKRWEKFHIFLSFIIVFNINWNFAFCGDLLFKFCLTLIFILSAFLLLICRFFFWYIVLHSHFALDWLYDRLGYSLLNFLAVSSILIRYIRRYFTVAASKIWRPCNMHETMTSRFCNRTSSFFFLIFKVYCLEVACVTFAVGIMNIV